MKKLSNTEAELKKRVAYKKVCSLENQQMVNAFWMWQMLLKQ